MAHVDSSSLVNIYSRISDVKWKLIKINIPTILSGKKWQRELCQLMKNKIWNFLFLSKTALTHTLLHIFPRLLQEKFHTPFATCHKITRLNNKLRCSLLSLFLKIHSIRLPWTLSRHRKNSAPCNYTKFSFFDFKPFQPSLPLPCWRHSNLNRPTLV